MSKKPTTTSPSVKKQPAKIAKHVNEKIKLIANPQQFETFLSRNCTIPLIPESRLVLAILRQAAGDAQEAYANYLRSYSRKVKAKAPLTGFCYRPQPIGEFIRDEVMQFWLNGSAGKYAEIIGLDADFVLKEFIDHLGIDFELIGKLTDAQIKDALSLALQGDARLFLTAQTA